MSSSVARVWGGLSGVNTSEVMALDIAVFCPDNSGVELKYPTRKPLQSN